MTNSKLYVVDPGMGQVDIGSFAHVTGQRQKWAPSAAIPRHRHTEAYATIILVGGLQECGCRGRIDVEPGDVLMHGAFDTHLDRIFVKGAEVLNLRMPGLGAIACARARIGDPDLIARMAETDPVAAATLLYRDMQPVETVPQDWPDLLATDLMDDPNRHLGLWAEEHQMSAETLSRGFGRVFGVTPAGFRSEMRTRKAFEQIMEGTTMLSKVLEVSGFDTQAHLSRAVRSMTGATPLSWVMRAPFKRSSSSVS